jgi:hypothetical protein
VTSRITVTNEAAKQPSVQKVSLLIVKEVLQMAVMSDRGEVSCSGNDLMERPVRTVAHVLPVAVDTVFCCLWLSTVCSAACGCRHCVLLPVLM